ncbi:hypothetical protein BH18ACT12_BH18ACT12_15970 [soil metagenome]
MHVQIHVTEDRDDLLASSGFCILLLAMRDDQPTKMHIAWLWQVKSGCRCANTTRHFRHRLGAIVKRT